MGGTPTHSGVDNAGAGGGAAAYSGPMIPSIPLNDGTTLPGIGLGTYGLTGDEGITSMLSAVDAGYRLLDSALVYGNEREVGEAVRRSGVDRDDIVVTSKVRGRHHGFDETMAGFDETLRNLGLDRVDLYLIHWPLPRVDRFVDTWRAMIELRARGLVRSIGVSNFTPETLEKLVGETGVEPAVNQIEVHPRFPQGAMRAVNAARGIVTESWSPLGDRDTLLRDPAVVEIAGAHGATPTQVVLRWHVQLGCIPLPKSGDPERQRQNLDVFGFSLAEEEIQAISALESGRLWDADPRTHEEF